MSVHRLYNFSAGPAVLPVPVLEEAQRDLVALPGVGMSVLEISHRSKPFDEIIHGAEADMRSLAGIPDTGVKCGNERMRGHAIGPLSAPSLRWWR